MTKGDVREGMTKGEVGEVREGDDEGEVGG